jgi:hypothetical protein
MHKVSPNIEIISTDGEYCLGNITIVTMINRGTYPIKFGFSNTAFDKLEAGQSVSFEAGANTTFTEDAKLIIEFIDLEVIDPARDYKYITLLTNRLTEASKAWQNPLIK